MAGSKIVFQLPIPPELLAITARQFSVKALRDGDVQRSRSNLSTSLFSPAGRAMIRGRVWDAYTRRKLEPRPITLSDPLEYVPEPKLPEEWDPLEVEGPLGFCGSHILYHDTRLYVLEVQTGTLLVLKGGKVVSRNALWELERFWDPNPFNHFSVHSFYMHGSSVCCVCTTMVEGVRLGHAFRATRAAGREDLVVTEEPAAGWQQAEAGGHVYGLNNQLQTPDGALEPYHGYRTIFAGGKRLYWCNGKRLDAWEDGRHLYTAKFAGAQAWGWGVRATAVLDNTVYIGALVFENIVREGGVPISFETRGVLFAVGATGVAREVPIRPHLGAVTGVTVTPDTLTYKADGRVYAYDTMSKLFLGSTASTATAFAAGSGRLFALRGGYVDVY
jgi:hypothetical protein